MAWSRRESQVSNKCVQSSCGTLSRPTAHLTRTPRTFHELLQLCQKTCSRTRLVPSGNLSECLYSASLLSDGLQCGSVCQHDEQVPHAFACGERSASSTIPQSWRSTCTFERNLKFQPPHGFSSPENTCGFPILVSMTPRPAGGGQP